MLPLSDSRFTLILGVVLCLAARDAFAQTNAELTFGRGRLSQNSSTSTTPCQPTTSLSAPDAKAACKHCGEVYTLNGSGCLRSITDDLQRAVGEAGLPLHVVDFAWSNGLGRIFTDLRCQSHHQAKGEELAGLILAHRYSHPGGRIYLVCHSSGAAVVLAAVKCLPPGSVDRIIMLAAAVSSSYDLRRALACAREGMDCFYSPMDLTSCSLALFGTSDGYHKPSAGYLSFTPVADGSGDGAYQNLRQYGWSSTMMQAGNFGGHYGCTRLGFLRDYVVPLLAEGLGRK
jgi:hypothetical protein